MPVDTSTTAEEIPGSSLYGLYILSLAVCGLGNLFIRIGARAGWLPPWAQATLAVTCALPLVIAAVVFWRLLRRDLDEMMQKIVLEGMAFALTIYIPLAAIYMNLATAGVRMPRLDPPDILFLPAVLIAIGIAIARRRYA